MAGLKARRGVQQRGVFRGLPQLFSIGEIQILVKLCLSDQVRVAFDVGVSSFSQVLVHHVFVFTRSTLAREAAHRKPGWHGRRGMHVQKRSDLVGLRFPRSIDREQISILARKGAVQEFRTG